IFKCLLFFFSSRRRHTRFSRDWSSDVCSSDLGARRWIGLGIINLQIAEVAKLAMIVFLAAYLQRHQLEVRASWLGFLRPTGMLGIVALLLLLQPDFGSAVVICGTDLGLLFLGGVQLWIFGALLGLGGTLLALLAITSPYRLQRLVTFL